MGNAQAISWCSTMADAPRMDHKQLRRAKNGDKILYRKTFFLNGLHD